MEAARLAPEEMLDVLFPMPGATLKPAPPPPSLGAQDLEPLQAPWDRILLARLLRETLNG